MYLDNQEAWEFSGRPDTPDEKVLYNYIQELARKPSAQAHDAFYRLLFDLNTYPQNEVSQALRKIINAREFERTGKYIINRCFYIIRNLWNSERTRHEDLRKLIRHVEEMPSTNSMERGTRKWRKQIQDYLASDLYIVLKRQMRLLGTEIEQNQQQGEKFGDNLKRYHFVQETVTTTDDIPFKLRESIHQDRARRAEKLNQELREYANNGKSSNGAPLINPTGIDGDLREVIWAYLPDRDNSILSQAKDFSQHVPTFRNLQQLRQELSSFIREPLIKKDEIYNRGSFKSFLEEALKQGDPDNMPVTQISVVTICRRALKFLVVEDIPRTSAVHFLKLIDKVGHQVVTTVLLRIVLFCRNVCLSLESRFGILFDINENKLKSDMDGRIVQAFEHMNVGLALNYKEVGYGNV